MPIGYTTRPPRASEENGVDYHFISNPQFNQMKRELAFIGNDKRNNREYGCLKEDIQYGYLKEDITTPLKNGLDLLLILTNHGLRIIENLYDEQVISIFIAPNSLNDLGRRLSKRETYWSGATNEEEKEIFGFNREYHFQIINEDLASSCKQICSIITKITP